ncbi:unnamed protein product [Mycena citricolor]|uniref:Uncharacterized protein n=1 Tax=Mycena citricolor TaxID=2018698 RepID=A0AAD2GWZ5_9AGAR|nr:unnamed protein product [Mycena citricolor]
MSYHRFQPQMPWSPPARQDTWSIKGGVLTDALPFGLANNAHRGSGDVERIKAIMELAERASSGVHQGDPSYPSDRNGHGNNDEDLQRIVKAIEDLNSPKIPFFSRHGGRNVETTLPALVGFIMTALYNSNNVASEASPVTSLIELEVGEMLCQKIGFSADKNVDIHPWAHLTRNNDSALKESLEVARRLKFIPLALRSAIDDGQLEFLGDMAKVTPAGAETKLLKQCSVWELLNTPSDEIARMVDSLQVESGISAKLLQDAIRPYLMEQTRISERYNIDSDLPPGFIVSSSQQFRWGKSQVHYGPGYDTVQVDNAARLDIPKLDALLQDRLDKKQAVCAVAVTVGTREGAVDPLDQVLALRDKYEQMGLSFQVSVDACRAGCFLDAISSSNTSSLSQHTTRQLQALKRADSVILDLYSDGAAPSPAGAACYRNSRVTKMTIDPTGVYDGDTEPQVSLRQTATVLTSSPAIYHRSQRRQDLSLTVKQMSRHWSMISETSKDYVVVPLIPQVNDGDSAQHATEKQFVHSRMSGRAHGQFYADPDAMTADNVAPDLNVIVFASNFMLHGKPNTDIEDANYFNHRVRDLLTVAQQIPFSVNSSVMGAEYDSCVREYRKRLGLETMSTQDLLVLSSAITFPVHGPTVDSMELARHIFEEEARAAIDRATVKPQIHRFIMFGRGDIYLTNEPLFHNANGRMHLVMHAELSERAIKSVQVTIPDASLNGLFTCRTLHETTLDEIVASKEIQVVFDQCESETVTLSDLKVVKIRSLESRWRDESYNQRSTPFYAFGSPEEIHIEHMLLHAQNTQISADRVKLEVQPPLSAEQLARGVRIELMRPEMSFLPPTEENSPDRVFKRGASFDVVVFDDPHAPDAHGPGLAEGGDELGRGRIELSGGVRVDWKCLNQQDFGVAPSTTRKTSPPPPSTPSETWGYQRHDNIRFGQHGHGGGHGFRY